ncbi:MAG: hypothetical protein K9J32_07080 [Synechococcus lacustris]|jgi:DNA-binding response OmpR family regulator|nr:hypothetical protein [Synechococcus lacustris]
MNPIVRPNILIICKISANSTQLAGVLSKHGFEVEEADSIEAFDSHLDKKGRFALVLLDLSGFNESIWPRCSQLSKVNIPFLIIASRDLLGLRQQCSQHGARHVFVKPLRVAHLLETIRIIIG